MMKKMMKYVLSTLLALSGITMIMVLSLQLYAYHVPWYMNRMDKYEISEYTGIDRNDIERICEKLAGYLQGTTQDINITADVHGSSREVFNEKEIQHMVDVRSIFDLVRLLTAISIVVFIGCAIALIKIYGKKTFYRGIMITGLVPPVLIIVPLIAAIIDFHGVFTLFHELFFTNELWLLDPETDILIQMLPQPFFESTALLWGVTAMAVFFGCIVLGITGLTRMKRGKK